MSVSCVEIDAPAKVNLWLRVLAREESGFHGLETLLCAIDVCDRVRVERVGHEVTLEVSGAIDTGAPGQNLALRAARLALAALGRERDGLHVRLEKRIPAAAGLGGGSSDAAAVLRGVARLYGGLPRERLLQLGIELGSDVPFFLCGSPLALAWSRGERLLALPPLPAAAVLVAHPGEPMPTAGAFARIAELRGGGYTPRARALAPAGLSTWTSVAELAENDFEPVARERIARIAAGLQAMRAAGARVALLAGSGASIFGVFDGEAERDGAEAAVRGAGFTTWRATTLTRLPTDGQCAPGGLTLDQRFS